MNEYIWKRETTRLLLFQFVIIFLLLLFVCLLMLGALYYSLSGLFLDVIYVPLLAVSHDPFVNHIPTLFLYSEASVSSSQTQFMFHIFSINSNKLSKP